MRFGHLLEFHKIPEWYTEYLDYVEMRNLIDEHKQGVKAEKFRKLSSDYILNLLNGVEEFVDYTVLVKNPNEQG